MNAYEAKQEARRERMLERAERLRGKAATDFRKADLREEVSGIPLGQPILVGHHSERRHRNAIKRADNAMRRAIATDKYADELERRASNPSTAISSDDPDAPAKLQAKIEKAEAAQEKMKAVNKILTKKKTTQDEKIALLISDAGMTEDKARAAFVPDHMGGIGFPSWALSNNNANIRRMKQRLAQLDQAPTETVERVVGNTGIHVVENADENRLQIVFPDKPSADVRKTLKQNGFRWSPRNGAWQRHLNNGARYAADMVLKAIKDA